MIRKHTEEENAVLEVAMDAGHLLLENGAEISRVEETMDRIAKHFGVADSEFFVLSNGIFTTGGSFARVEHIPVHGAQLDRVAAVNQLSRDMESHALSLEQMKQRLQKIRVMKGPGNFAQILASAVGAGAFCILFGGSIADGIAAFIAGFLLYIFVLYGGKQLHSKIITNIIGGALVSAVCLAAKQIFPFTNLNFMIVGSIIPLVPGVAFTNGIRDIGDGDYLAGTVRLLDALLVFVCVAVGVGCAMAVWLRLGGTSI